MTLPSVPILHCQNNEAVASTDVLAPEEPLEILLEYGSYGARKHFSLAVVMRTPGDEEALCRGFLLTEGIIALPEQIEGVRCLEPNRWMVELRPGIAVDAAKLQRNLYAASSCGICGKASLEAVQTLTCHFPLRNYPMVPLNVLYTLPDRLRAAQSGFEQTGGLHAAALFAPAGNLLYLKEDVGRHNAVDKVLGAALMGGLSLPFRDVLLLVSGRAGFELAQKATMAGIPILAAVGAPSSLAVDVAEANGLTLVGFLRGARCNVYAHPGRVRG